MKVEIIFNENNIGYSFLDENNNSIDWYNLKEEEKWEVLSAFSKGVLLFGRTVK